MKIAILIPCYNEQATIVKVVDDFRKELPESDIYVFDNNSTDRSYELAKNAGAIVIKEKNQGKGFVVNSMLKKVQADFYVMVDGDDTYPADMVHELLKPVMEEEADMIVGQRLSNYSEKAFRPMHYAGNKLVCNLINLVFSSHIKDPMSGYRAFNREVALELPVLSSGFDIETEMTLQLLYRKFKIKEVEVPYRNRPRGSFSKLNTFRDGFKVLYKIFTIVQAYKPLTFFGGIGLLCVFIGLFIGGGVLREISHSGQDLSILNALIAMGFFVSGIVCGTIGILLHILNYRLLEISNILNRHTFSTRTHLSVEGESTEER